MDSSELLIAVVVFVSAVSIGILLLPWGGHYGQ